MHAIALDLLALNDSASLATQYVEALNALKTSIHLKTGSVWDAVYEVLHPAYQDA